MEARRLETVKRGRGKTTFLFFQIDGRLLFTI